jgi:hypothetical protein
MGHVEMTDQGRVVFVFPEYPDRDGKPTRVPLDEDHIAPGPIAGRERWESAKRLSDAFRAFPQPVNVSSDLLDRDQEGTDHALE